ncbi:MAG: LysR substrate-binding domain-containing protein [Granulosicoccus sp.]
MSNRNLPIDLIRTLITISEVGGYTRAAHVLGRTQPAITLQIKRLEALVNAKLVSQVGQKSILTDDGQLLAVYGRKILRLNDDALAKFSPQTPGDTLRIGLPTDFATAYLQDALMHFNQQMPAVALKIHCNLSARLIEDLHEDEHDIIIALYSDEDNQYLFHHWSQQPIWACSEQFKVKKQQPVPIIAHHEGCAYRDRMTSVLARERRQWNIVFSAPGIAELQSAVLASFGVTALTRTTLLHGMREINEDEGFPALPPIQLGIFYRHSQMSESGSRLIKHLNSHLSKLAELDSRI